MILTSYYKDQQNTIYIITLWYDLYCPATNYHRLCHNGRRSFSQLPVPRHDRQRQLLRNKNDG